MSEIDEKLRAIETQFGFELHSHQRLALRALGEGKNVIVHAPTGGGKSAIFQAAPEVLPNPGITVVLYPLRALVKDQTRRAAEMGLSSVTLYGDTKTKDRPQIYDQIAAGDVKMLLTTPESFDRNRKLQQVIAARGVNLLVVDEAHAYEEWADGFRPTYRNAGIIAEKVGVKQFLLCSATLTSNGYKNATSTLRRSDWAIVQVPPVRPNLIYKNLSEPSIEILSRAVSGTGLKAPGIVFFTTIKALNELADAIQRRSGKAPLRYHGGMSAKDRRISQETFMGGDHWIFATKAFGMGIDKSNIRNIVHAQTPSSILSYAQETGRAGRDGQESMCFLTQTERGDAAQFLLDMSVPTPEMVKRVWSILNNLALGIADGWFEVDWEDVAADTDLWPATVQACVSWLFTGKMIEKRQKKPNWKFIFSESTDLSAAKYGYGATDVVDTLRAEACLDGGAGSFDLKPEELAEVVGGLFTDWRGKLRKLAEKGIFELEEPPKERARYKFKHREFVFAQGADQLKRARANAFRRLDEMRKLQQLRPDERRDAIEQAISLNIDELSDAEEVEVLCEDDDSSSVPF